MNEGWLSDVPPLVGEPLPARSVVPTVALVSHCSTDMASATPVSNSPVVLGKDLAAIVAVGRLSPDVDEETCVSQRLPDSPAGLPLLDVDRGSHEGAVAIHFRSLVRVQWSHLRLQTKRGVSTRALPPPPNCWRRGTRHFGSISLRT